MKGDAASAPASVAVRATAGQPIRERPPKQPHGDPVRPRAIATRSATATSPSRGAAREEELDPVGGAGEVVLVDELGLSHGDHPIPGDPAGDGPDPIRDVGDLRTAAEGFEVDVAQPPELGPAGLEVEPPRNRAQV